ncbi:MAG TPA: L-histidine N(alpha)-methyltransferase [Spongiibacteraceae bacterium]|nr:L-histidine N(alpha)-methyltransferase [Spongiibacteraceae bacterium]|tara:strand:- start:448 stop:1410 length:963 start_codon:yes stop_codon:yes gene_type:complete
MRKVIDLQPDTSALLEESIAGLKASPRQLPCKYFYDAEGARLFEQICELPEYYPTRTEVGILKQHLPEMAKLIGANARIVEYGSGAGTKIRLLLDALREPVAYTPIDISREQLAAAAEELQRDFAELEIQPVCADYSSALTLPSPQRAFARSVVFFPGSTIGNFPQAEALALLKRFARLAAQGDQPGGLLIGVDVKKSRQRIEAAYNDTQGVTADFNLNILKRLNREVGANFELEHWQHHAFWNEQSGAIEMHLVSRREQQVRINGDRFTFAEGDSVHTENSFKYSPDEFTELAAQAGFVRRGLWQDEEQLFSVQYFELP